MKYFKPFYVDNVDSQIPASMSRYSCFGCLASPFCWWDNLPTSSVCRADHRKGPPDILDKILGRSFCAKFEHAVGKTANKHKQKSILVAEHSSHFTTRDCVDAAGVAGGGRRRGALIDGYFKTLWGVSLGDGAAHVGKRESIRLYPLQ